jgi:putative ABC transport system ATP-binding protein
VIAMTATIQVSNVVRHYRRGNQEVEVLHNITFEVGTGELVALIGPSGSGKTTLLNLLGGLDAPDKGEIVVAGERIDRMPSAALTDWRARHVGFVFQFYNLLQGLSAERNVEVPLLRTSLSQSKRRRIARAALALVGLQDRASHRPAELSGGQQQRVAIARAVVADPSIILCDEPTGDLDRATADQILELLQTLSRDHGKTIVMVTHDPLAAARATRTLSMDKGRLGTASSQIAVPAGVLA